MVLVRCGVEKLMKNSPTEPMPQPSHLPTYYELIDHVYEDVFSVDAMADHTGEQTRAVGGPMMHHVCK